MKDLIDSILLVKELQFHSVSLRFEYVVLFEFDLLALLIMRLVKERTLSCILLDYCRSEFNLILNTFEFPIANLFDKAVVNGP
jgi:hypothetical protein